MATLDHCSLREPEFQRLQINVRLPVGSSWIPWVDKIPGHWKVMVTGTLSKQPSGLQGPCLESKGRNPKWRPAGCFNISVHPKSCFPPDDRQRCMSLSFEYQKSFPRKHWKHLNSSNILNHQIWRNSSGVHLPTLPFPPSYLHYPQCITSCCWKHDKTAFLSFLCFSTLSVNKSNFTPKV